MTIPKVETSPVLPIWRGRRGAVATVLIGVLAVICGMGLAELTERVGVVPACREYALAQRWQYLSYHTIAATTRTGAICTFKSAEGHTEDIRLLDISVWTNFWVSFTVSLHITIPGFMILFAVMRTWLWRISSASRSPAAN